MFLLILFIGGFVLYVGFLFYMAFIGTAAMVATWPKNKPATQAPEQTLLMPVEGRCAPPD